MKLVFVQVGLIYTQCEFFRKTYFQTPPRAIFSNDADVRGIGASSDKSVQIVMSQVSHLE